MSEKRLVQKSFATAALEDSMLLDMSPEHTLQHTDQGVHQEVRTSSTRAQSSDQEHVLAPTLGPEAAAHPQNGNDLPASGRVQPMAGSHFQTPSSPPRDDLETPLNASNNHSLDKDLHASDPHDDCMQDIESMVNSNHSFAKEMQALNSHDDCDAASQFQTPSAPSCDDLETPLMASRNHSFAKDMQSYNPHNDWIQQMQSVANNSSLARHKQIYAKQPPRFKRLYPLSPGEARLSNTGCPTSRETLSTRPARALPRSTRLATPHIPRHSANSDMVSHDNSTAEHEHIRSVATS